MTPIAPRTGGAALFWVVAIACLLAAIAGLTARLAERTATVRSAALREALIARVLAPEAPDVLGRAATQLAAMNGVDRVRVVTPERAAALLHKWGGPEVDPKQLPALRLIELRSDRQPTEDWAKSVERAMAVAGFRTEIYGPGPVLQKTAESAVQAARTALGAGIVLAIAALLTAGLAGRARVAADSAVIAPLADMGATRGQISRMFAGRAALEGFMAGLVGAFCATILAVLLLSRGQDVLPVADWAQRLELTDGAPLAAAPLLAALLAAAGARTASNRFYRLAARRP